MSFVPALLLLILLAWNATAGALTLTDEEKPGSALTHTCAWASMPPGRLSSFATVKAVTGLAADYVALIQSVWAYRSNRSSPAIGPRYCSRLGKTHRPAPRHHVDARTPAIPRLHPPLPDFPIVILAHKGGPQPRTLEDLYGLKVAVVENYAPMSCCALTTRT